MKKIVVIRDSKTGEIVRCQNIESLAQWEINLIRWNPKEAEIIEVEDNSIEWYLFSKREREIEEHRSNILKIEDMIEDLRIMLEQEMLDYKTLLEKGNKNDNRR